MIAQAEQLSPTASAGGEIQRRGSNAAAAEAVLHAVVAETSQAPLVILGCDTRTSRAVLSAHVELENLFPHLVRIPDPDAALAATVAREYSETERRVAFAPNLEEALCGHIADNHAGPKGDVEGGFRFARALVDAAIRRMSERRASAAAANAKASSGSGISSSSSSSRSSGTATAGSLWSTEETRRRRQSEVVMLTQKDFEIGKELGDEEARKKVYREVEGLVGMTAAKAWLKEVRSQIDYTNLTGSKSGLKRCYNLVLTGNPGTGKTTFARLVHRFLKAHGVLTGEFVEKNALELKGEYVGSTTPLVKAAFAEAKGGTLFLDEAYGLSSDNFKGGGDSFSKEAVRTLLTEVENNRTGTVVILAG